MVSISWASFMPLFGKKRKEVERRARLARDWESCAFALDREVTRLRQYINEQMRHHFETYNGGMVRQMHQMAKLCLPTPWVPAAIENIDDPVSNMVDIRTITYVREVRMVPITQAGRV